MDFAKGLCAKSSISDGGSSKKRLVLKPSRDVIMVD